eukprot:361921-Chlamydomonas_euryale.AAC.10
MIGDGATDLEAVQVTGGADLFIGYGGVVERPAVKAEADWFVTDYSVLEASLKRYKVNYHACLPPTHISGFTQTFDELAHDEFRAHSTEGVTKHGHGMRMRQSLGASPSLWPTTS